MRKKVVITGKVQGVGYRAACVREARKYKDMKGYIRNLQDGRVEAVFEGNDGDVEEMVKWCKEGPEEAKVKRVVTEADPEVPFDLGPFDTR